jgi:hypothetical protein
MRAWMGRGARARRIAAAGAAAAAALAAVGLLHLPWARPLLARLGGCPASRVSPAQVERAQGRAWASLRGAGAAPGRPALGFALGGTTRGEVEAWARARALSCERLRDGALLRCAGVPAGALGAAAYDDVSFGFRLRDARLVNVTTLRGDLPAAEAAARLADAAARLSRALGPPQRAAAPGAGLDFLQYRYVDYLADVTAMSIPGRGHAVREHYMAGIE